MLYEEFNEILANKGTDMRVSLEEYRIIETIYLYHPCIPTVGGHEKIASLFIIGGMTLMYDMLVRAEKIEELNSDEISLKKKLKELQDRIKILRGELDG